MGANNTEVKEEKTNKQKDRNGNKVLSKKCNNDTTDTFKIKLFNCEFNADDCIKLHQINVILIKYFKFSSLHPLDSVFFFFL